MAYVLVNKKPHKVIMKDNQVGYLKDGKFIKVRKNQEIKNDSSPSPVQKRKYVKHVLSCDNYDSCLKKQVKKAVIQNLVSNCGHSQDEIENKTRKQLCKLMTGRSPSPKKVVNRKSKKVSSRKPNSKKLSSKLTTSKLKQLEKSGSYTGRLQRWINMSSSNKSKVSSRSKPKSKASSRSNSPLRTNFNPFEKWNANIEEKNQKGAVKGVNINRFKKILKIK